MNKRCVIFFNPLNSSFERGLIIAAEELAKERPVFLLCDKTRKTQKSGKITYAPTEYSHLLSGVETIVILSSSYHLPDLYKRFPEANFFLLGTRFPAFFNLIHKYAYLEKSRTTVLGNSLFHKTYLEKLFKEHNLPLKKISFDYLPYPIEDDLQPDDTPVDNKKLFLLSKTEKTRAYALEIFNLLSRREKDFKLYAADYNDSWSHARKSFDNIFLLSQISHGEVIGHLRSSLCLFYPDYITPDTSGIIPAEANAVGTPVIAHNFGALPEVVAGGDQLINCTDKELVVERIIYWSQGNRPRVLPNEKMRLKNVIAKWKQLLLPG